MYCYKKWKCFHYDSQSLLLPVTTKGTYHFLANFLKYMKTFWTLLWQFFTFAIGKNFKYLFQELQQWNDTTHLLLHDYTKRDFGLQNLCQHFSLKTFMFMSPLTNNFTRSKPFILTLGDIFRQKQLVHKISRTYIHYTNLFWFSFPQVR